MAITHAKLQDGSDNVNRSTYTVPEASDTDLDVDKLYLLSLATRIVTAPAFAPTGVTQTGATWVKIDDQLFETADGWNISIWRTMVGSAVTAQDISVAFGATFRHLLWSLSEFDGVDKSGTDGSGAIVQSGKNEFGQDVDPSITLSAFGSADNRPYSANGIESSTMTGVAPGLDTEITEILNIESDSLHTQWDSATADNTVDSTHSASGTIFSNGMVALEIKIEDVAPSPFLVPHFYRPNTLRRL